MISRFTRSGTGIVRRPGNTVGLEVCGRRLILPASVLMSIIRCVICDRNGRPAPGLLIAYFTRVRWDGMLCRLGDSSRFIARRKRA
jgi:hypothetical protein